MSSVHTLRPGTRVRLRAPSSLLELKADTGTVVRPDEWLDYYVIRLDRPARYHRADGQFDFLSEIVEDVDNLEILQPEL